MDKAQWYQNFWSQFTWPAYDETTVPDKGDNPNATYRLTQDYSIVAGKSYYTRTGTAPDYVYSWVASPKAKDLSTYYEITDPTGTGLPYITYMVVEDELGNPVYPSASLWCYGTSWAAISQKAKEIAESITTGGKVYKLDAGRAWVQRGHPFAQRMGDDNDMIRRIVLNIQVEFLTAD